MYLDEDETIFIFYDKELLMLSITYVAIVSIRRKPELVIDNSSDINTSDGLFFTDNGNRRRQ
jgi:hypothetical protein